MRPSLSCLLLALLAGPPSAPRLAEEASPYLREHAADPVEWAPWSAGAFERARREQKPVLLVVGRWGCHACRSMERDLLGDPETAELLNRRFVSVLVDRDERPDVADLYASALMLMADTAMPGAGWPVIVVATAEGRPFFGARGSEGAQGPGLRAALTRLSDAYAQDHARLDAKAGVTVAALREAQKGEPPRSGLGPAAMTRALAGLREAFDAAHGGFGVAPKPLPHGALRLLLEEHQRTGDADALRMATRTLEAMALGGVRDHVGGGFHHASADEDWRLPRFEKTLADNALLLRAYAQAQAAGGNPVFRDAAEGIVAWALGELEDPAGGFRAGLDADSEAEEGKFYLWSREEILAALGAAKGREFLTAHRLDAPGVLSSSGPPVLGLGPRALRERRAARVPPAVDDRVFAGANGLMIGALATSGTLLGRREDVEAARRTAARVLERLGPPAALKRQARGGEARGSAFLEDYAYLAEGLLDLHEATKDSRWLTQAAAVADAALGRFLDTSTGALFSSDGAHGPLLARLRDGYDGELPSANGVMASVLVRLERLTGEKRYATLGRRVIEAFQGDLERAPRGMETLAAAAGELLGPPEAAQRAEPPRPEREVRGPVTVDVSLSSPTVYPGQLVEAAVRLAVAEGWCVTAHQPLAKGLVGLSVSAPGELVTASPIRYPEGTAVRGGFSREPIAAVHFGTATVAVPLRVAPSAPAGVVRVRLSVRFQACDARDCKAPENVVLEVPLTIVSGTR